MAEKRRGLGRGLGALIPTAPTGDSRPVDVFFPGAPAAVHQEVVGAPLGGARPGVPGSVGETDPQDGVITTTDTTTTDTTTTDTTAVPQGTTTSDGIVPRETTGQVAPASGPELVPVPGAHFAELALDAIVPNPRQPRSVFDEDALTELVGSIREIGVLQPVVVRPTGTVDGVATYELIMGERRLRASRLAGLERIPAIVRETDDADLLRDALLENLHRSELNALEEAAAYQQLLDDFGCTHEELARRIHRSRPQITNTLRLLKLPPLVQRRVAAGVISAGHARALLGLPDAAAMERLAQRIVAEGLSVRTTEEVVSLGGDAATPAVVRRPRAGDRVRALDDLAARLGDRFETRVTIALGKSKGKLTVEFASVADLNRILATLAPQDPGVLR